jgi:Ca2+-binding RTX toxin-like protein
VIENSIIAGNRADGPQHGPDLGGGPFDAAFTLVQDPSSIAINQTVAGSNIIGLDPLLGELSANGGQTRTMALLDGSPALDNGRTPAGETADQRGSARPSDLPAYPNSGAAGADGADIGAFERLGPPPPSGTCQGKPATLSGTDERDILNGTPGDDVIVGNGGNDAIRGFGGDDLICAGGGLDQVTGGEGNDRIIGEGENDRIYGQKGNDTLIDAPGADLLSGGIGNDVLKGGGNEDRLLGAAGNDRLFGQADDDVLLGAKGNDFLRGGPGKDRLSGGVGANDVQQ